MSDRTMKTGDSYPPLVRILEDDLGPIDLPVAATVRIIARKDASTFITDTCTVLTVADAVATGFLRGTWAAEHNTKRAGVQWNIDPADTAVAGDYPYEFEVTYNPSAAADERDIETFPNDSADNPVLHIVEDND